MTRGNLAARLLPVGELEAARPGQLKKTEQRARMHQAGFAATIVLIPSKPMGFARSGLRRIVV